MRSSSHSSTCPSMPMHASGPTARSWSGISLHPRSRNALPSCKKKGAIKDLIVAKNIRVDIQWIPRKQNDADRFLKHYIASLCGANGCEPLYRRVRRLESENTQLRARLKRAMKLLQRRSTFPPDAALSLEMLQ